MADINANIGVGIDTSDALNQLKNLQRQISSFHTSVAKSSEQAAFAQRDLQKNFINSVNAIQGFSAELRTVRTTAETFTNSLEKNKFSIREYFRYAASQSKTFGKNFASEFSTIEKTAIERVKTLQTQYIKMGRDASGAMQAIAIRPTVLNMKDLGTQTAIAAQKQVIFNQLVKQGSTNLLNFGKNTQWAGRQLMVGFTLPLATLGMTAGRVFMDMERAAIKFRKVYGDLFTPNEEREQALEDIRQLGLEFTKYGVAVAESVDVAAEAAAAGFAGVDLQNQTAAALKLSILGQLDLNKALETTIALQNAFKISSQDLASSIDFLNAVENQTVVSLDDITTAIPKVAPIINSLGGDVKDLAFFLAAMKEGGVNASEGANALKSGLASLINPTDKAQQMLGALGVNIKGVIEANKGDLKGIVVGFARELDRLDPLSRSRAIEQLFGKFQFARISALFDNVISETSQASRVLELAGTSIQDLAALSESELGVAASSSMNKFLGAIEKIKIALAPLGELFLEIATPFVEFGTQMLDAFNNLPEGVKKAIGTAITVIGGLGPILLMTFGLINNGIANMIKFFATVRLGYLKITGQAKGVGDETQYMTSEQLEAAAAAASLDQAHSNLIQRFTAEKVAVDRLRASYEQAVAAGNRFALMNPGMMKPGSPTKFATGGFVSGSGNKDNVPALLTPGEFVIKKDQAKLFLPLLMAINEGKVPGFQEGGSVGRTVSSGSRSYDTMGARSAKAISAFLEELKSSGQSLDAIGKMLDKLETEYGKLSAKAVKAAAKEAGMTARSGPKIQRMHLQEDLGIMPSGERVMGSLVRGGLETQNQQLRTGQTAEQFSKDWKAVTNGLVATLRDGGMQINDEVRKVAQAIDDEIHDAAIAIAKASNRDIIDDKVLAQATKEVIDKSAVAGGQRGAVAGVLQSQAQQRVIAPPTKASLMAAGQIQEGQGWTDWVRKNVAAGLAVLKKGTGEIQLEIEGKLRTIARVQTQEARDALNALTAEQQRASLSSGKLPDGSSLRLTTGERRALDPKAYTASSDRDSQLQGQSNARAYDKGVREELAKSKDAYEEKRKRNSPHKLAPKDGQSDAKAYDDAFEQQIEKVQQKPRRASSGGVIKFDERSQQYMSEEKFAKQESSRQQALQRATQMNINSIEKFSNRMMGLSFALTSVTGIASMFGGKIGEIAGVISQVSGLFFTLSIATSALIKSELARAAIGGATAAMSALPGRGLGRLFGGAGAAASAAGGGLAGLKAGAGAIKGNIGSVIQGAIGGMAKLSPVVGRLAGLFVKFIPVIGLAITAFSIGKMIFDKANQSINRLGETANLSSEKVKKLGDIFGVDPRRADFGAGFTGAAATGTSEQRSRTQQVLESEGFAEDFQTQIDAVKNAGKADAERTLNALALQLSAAGFDSAAVQAIIDAIVTKAERTDLNLKFASVNFASEEGLASITKIADETSKLLGDKFAVMGGDFGQQFLNFFGGGDFKTQIQTSAGEFASIFESLKIGFESGEITAEQFNEKIAEIDGTIRSLDPAIAKELVAAIADNLEIDDKINGLKNWEDQLMVIKATAAGIKISDDDIKLLEKAGEAGADPETIKAANKLREEYNRLIAETALETENANKQQEISNILSAEVQAGIDALAEETKGIETQTKAMEILTQRGYDEATAYDIASNAVYGAAIAAAAASDALGTTSGELDRVLELVNTLLEAQKRAPKRPATSGGAAKKSPYQEAIEQLKKERTEIKNNIKAYAGLRKAGFSVAEASAAAADATLAAALASKKVGSKEWNVLVAAIRKARLEALKTPEGLKAGFDGLRSRAEEYLDILERSVDAKYRDRIKSQEKAISDLEDSIASVNEELEGYQDQIDTIQRGIEVDFDRPIAALEEESSDLANDLTLMDRAADEITKRYDEQAQALQEVARVNQQIINQQKSQISLADALSSGDIATAASLMQDMRAASAEASRVSAEDRLNAAKEAELGSLRSASGMSREQIEQRQFEISQKVYQLEEQKEVKLLQIRGIEDTIYGIQKNRLEPLEKAKQAAEKTLENTEKQKQAELDAIDQIRQRWDDAELAIKKAEIKAGKFNEVIKMGRKLTGDIVSDWEKLKTKTITLTINTIRNEVTKSTKKANGGIIRKAGGGMIKNYLANGGSPFSSLGSDTVPAMLTPGEFVVNRKATSKFKPILSAINAGTFGGGLKQNRYQTPPRLNLPTKFNEPVYNMPLRNYAPYGDSGISYATSSRTEMPTNVDNSVYNYSLNVNVEGSNSSANEIANVVINKLRNIQSQQVRKQVIR